MESADPGPLDWPRATLESLGDAVFTLDRRGVITFLNPAAERLAGQSRERLRGRLLAEALHLVDEKSRQPLELGTAPFRHRALLLVPADERVGGEEGGDQERLLDVELTSLAGGPDASDHPEGRVLVLRDATEQVLAERARERLEDELRRRAEELVAADRRKDQFLAMLAHELRNPLAPIRNSVELMRQAENLDPSFQASREMVERQVKHLARLVDDLLDVSRITHGNIRLRKEGVDLGVILERAVEANRPLIEARNHTLNVELPPEPVRMDADPTRLEQIFSNLLNNAAKYTMPSGHIGLSAVLAGDEAVVRVRDTGIGVPPDVLERVFEPFVQSDGSLARSEGGLGIGLTLVRSLVEMHGGSVEAHSAGLGQGSEFVVRLPARAAIPSERPGAPLGPFASAPARGVRVLVVEDNVDAAESLAALLRLWHHDVQVVHDGYAAIDAARAQRPEVVLLDIGLPGLDGYQVARRLREDLGLDHALLVAMTGYGQPEDRRRSREAGIQHHFVKPVEPDVLRNLLSAQAAPVGAEPR